MHLPKSFKDLWKKKDFRRIKCKGKERKGKYLFSSKHSIIYNDVILYTQIEVDLFNSVLLLGEGHQAMVKLIVNLTKVKIT